MQILYMSIIALFIIAFFITLCIMILGYKYQKLLIKISKEISDGYIIFLSNGKITNYNDAFLKLFELNIKSVKKKNILDIFDKKVFSEKYVKKMNKAYENLINSQKNASFEITRLKDKKVFNLEMMSIVNNDIFMRYVIVVKDVTKTYELIEELHSNQEMMANREKFAVLRTINKWSCTFIKITYICHYWRIRTSS